jgi:hypothetical protein
MKNVVVIWRDGRDVLVSWYHHCLFKNDRGNAALVDIVRRELPFPDYADVWRNLPAFIEYSFTRQRHPRFSWADFVRCWHGRSGVHYVHYEYLRSNTSGELQRLAFGLSGKVLGTERAVAIAEEFSFARQSGRLPGEENKRSFMRKGIVGDWRNHFSQDACELFDHYAGAELILLGYESDSGWIHADKNNTRQEAEAKPRN